MSDKQKHVVITVHGIRTFGQWQRRLERLCSVDHGDIQFYHFDYGYFSMLAFAIPFTRWLLVRRFRRELRSVVSRVRPSRLDIIGHSFGTHLIAWSLRGLRPDEDIHVHTLVLAGSVLRSDFYWADLIPLRVARVVNDCGARDVALWASQFLVLFTGMAGRTGFVGMNGPEFSNRYSAFGHSGYFLDRHGQPSDEYMFKRWLPLIVDRNASEQFDERSAPTAWSGIAIWITNNFEPIKLMLITTPLIAGLIWIGALYIETNATKERAAAVIELGEAMKQKNKLPAEAKPLFTTMQQSLGAPLRRTAVLWVDDEPTGNVHEQTALMRFGHCFAHAKSTADAIRLLKANPEKFTLVISDFSRPADPQGGYGLLDEMKKRNFSIPFIFYTLDFTWEQALEAKTRGAKAEVNDPIDLWMEVFNSIRRNSAPIGRLELIAQQLVACRQF